MMKRAFTLIELLTVMAISAILLGLIIVPLVQSFNMTRTAQAFADAQDRARVLTERIAQEVGNGASVRSGSGLVISNLNGASAKLLAHSLVVQVPGRTGLAEVALPYTKIDIVKPAEGDPVRGPNGAYIDPATGLEDPTLTAPKGQVVVPVVPGQTVVRYFIGLRDPFQNYNNPYDGVLMGRNSQQDNLYVLYRAEVQPVLADGSVNLAFFAQDANGRPVMDDPRFFTPNRDGSGNIVANDDHAQRIKNWLGVGDPGYAGVPANATRRAVVMTELSRYDMIQSQFDSATKSVIYDGDIPRLVPMVQFRPSRVSNEPAQGQVAARIGEESANSVALAPSMYSASHSVWDRALIRNWPRLWNPTDANANAYNIARGDMTNGDPGAAEGMAIYYYDPDIHGEDFSSGVEVFDLSLYERMASTAALYPFSQAVAAADVRSSWLSNNAARDTFVPFTYNPGKGTIRTDFSISEVGDWTVMPPADNPGNLPGKLVSVTGSGPYTPATDPDTSGNFYDANHQTVNELFNKVWADNPAMRPNIQRFIDLRVTPNADGTMGPLHPTTGFWRTTIVPGSEEVYGPDQNPGPNFGRRIRYTRTTRIPGPNQYRINYTDIREPDYLAAGYSSVPPAAYDPQNFMSAIIQPRFKKGYIQLNSDPNAALPVDPVTGIGEILVSYRFQLNGAGATSGAREDIFAVDYDTRELMDVLLTMRNYPQSTLPNPQVVTLKSTATVRNYTR